MISLMVFLLAVCYDKYLHAPTSQAQPSAGKKVKKGPENSAPNTATTTNASNDASSVVPERERLVLVTKVLRELKQTINAMDLLLGKTNGFARSTTFPLT